MYINIFIHTSVQHLNINTRSTKSISFIRTYNLRLVRSICYKNNKIKYICYIYIFKQKKFN